jgi:PTS system nitrogen regulatory IIA component
MDLKLSDVAELLDLSEDTVRCWVADGKIPCYRIHQQVRFNRSEIENWLLASQKGSDITLFSGAEDKTLFGTHQFSLLRAVHRGGIYYDVPGSTKEAVIRSSMEQIARDLQLDADILTDLLLDREALMSTGLSKGIAIPHTRDFLLQEAFDVVPIVFPKQSIDFDSLDREEVHTLFFLFACDDKRHLHLLAKLAHFGQSEENIRILQSRPNPATLLAHLKGWEESLHTSSKIASIPK